MPSFNGEDIFGVATKMRRDTDQRDQQLNGFPGINGLESLDMGMRGRNTTVEGMLYGFDKYSLGQAILYFESYIDGHAYVLVDKFGIAWANVKLEQFQYDPKIGIDAYYGLMVRYSAVFHHLT